MKRRWHRIVVALAVIVPATCLLVAGGLFWLHRSGYPATLAQDLLHRFDGRNVTAGRIEFPTWKTITLIDVRFQWQMAGWNVTVVCPRLEAHYGVVGLLTKRIDTLHLRRPRVILTQSPDLPLMPSVPSRTSQALAALPLGRVKVQQGTLHIHGRRQHYVLAPFDAVLRQPSDGALRIEAEAQAIENTPVVGAGVAFTAGDVRLAAAASSSPLSEILAPILSVPWQIEHGQLTSKVEFEVKQQTLRGDVTLTVERLQVQGQNLGLRDAVLDTAFSLEANLRRGDVRLDGTATLRAEAARLPADVAATKVAVATPWRLSYAMDGWKLAATPDIQVHTATFGATLQVSGLTTAGPVEIQHTDRGPQFGSTLNLKAQQVRLHPGATEQPVLQIASLQGRLPVRGSVTALTFSNAEMQTQAWQWLAAAQPEVVPGLTLRGSGSIDLRQQHLTLQDTVATVPQLGSLSAAGEWYWSSQTGRDLYLQLEPTDLKALKERLQVLLPAAWRPWQMAGNISMQVRATRLGLREPRLLHGLVLTWRFHDAALSAPNGTYASEHVNGTLQASAAFDGISGQGTLQGTMTLQPFALLVGSLFPALEDNRLTSVVTYSGMYDTVADRLRLYVAGQFSDLGVVKLEGEVQRPLGTPRYDLQARLYTERAARLWQTLVYDPIQFPTLADATMQGQLDCRLQLQGRASEFTLRGTLDLTDLTFRSDTADIRGVTLRLPVQMHHPLPSVAPEDLSLSPEAYGPLHIAAMRIGGIQLGGLSTRVALRSDSLLFEHDIRLSGLGGYLRLERISAAHLLRSQRRIAMRVRLHELDLRQLGRGPTSLPLAGRLNGDLSHLQIHGDRLETQGALTLEVAGGAVRIDGIQGSHLFSAVPTWRGSLTAEKPLSLSRLTEIYPIGGMGGSLHFTVTDLALTAWEPTAFVLDFAVQSPGGERREITLRALNNLLFTTGSVKVASSLLGETYRLPYKRFGATLTLHNDILQVRGKYHDREGREYIMQAPALGGGVSIVNRVPENGMPFQDFVQRLKATVLEKPDVQVK
jgi:hypothetical protein